MPPPTGLPGAFSLAGHRVLLTGGSGGLGGGIASCFIASGAEVVLTGTRADKVDAAAKALGPSAAGMVHDVTDTGSASSFAAKVEAEHGPISILVNNAGQTVKKPIEDMQVEEFERVMDTHVVGAFALVRAFLPQLLQHESPSILFTASMASFLGIPHVAGYSAAKAAHVGLVRSLSTELLPRGIRVNGVAPGWIATDLFRQATSADPARLQKIMSRIPMGELGLAEAG